MRSPAVSTTILLACLEECNSDDQQIAATYLRPGPVPGAAFRHTPHARPPTDHLGALHARALVRVRRVVRRGDVGGVKCQLEPEPVQVGQSPRDAVEGLLGGADGAAGVGVGPVAPNVAVAPEQQVEVGVGVLEDLGVRAVVVEDAVDLNRKTRCFRARRRGPVPGPTRNRSAMTSGDIAARLPPRSI